MSVAEKKQSLRCEEWWKILLYAPKWENSGVFIPVATGNFQAPTLPESHNFEVQPPGQKQSKKRCREDLLGNLDTDSTVVIYWSHDISSKQVQAHKYCNCLSKAMIDLETQSRAIQLFGNNLKILETDESKYTNEFTKLVVRPMKKEAEGRCISHENAHTASGLIILLPLSLIFLWSSYWLVFVSSSSSNWRNFLSLSFSFLILLLIGGFSFIILQLMNFSFTVLLFVWSSYRLGVFFFSSSSNWWNFNLIKVVFKAGILISSIAYMESLLWFVFGNLTLYNGHT